MTAASALGALAPAGRLDLRPTGSGPLDGVRVAVKDLYDVAGTVTAAGNPTLAAAPPASRDAAAVAALRHAGAIVAAKTATDELAMGMFGVNSHYGTPLNPAAPGRVPGGSSSGSASIVAAGDADLGLGSDTGGSIRVPAAFCGLFGLRPTHARLDTDGLRPMAPRFDTVGLMAREPALLQAAFAVLAGGGRTPQRRVRALVLLEDLLGVSLDTVAARTVATATAAATTLGWELRRAPLSHAGTPATLVSAFWPLMSRQLWQTNGEWVTRDRPRLGEGIEARILAAGQVADDEVETAEQARDELVARLGELLDDAVAVLPTTWAPAPALATPHGELMAWRDRNLAHVVCASLTGAPQLTVPAGVAKDIDGPAPVGVSLLGLPGDDELLLDLAADLPGAEAVDV